jgi:diaminopimelate decarboxylase
MKIRRKLLLAVKELKEDAEPTIIFDLKTIENNLMILRQIGEKHKCLFLMAAKSFCDSRIHKLAVQYLNGFDVSNLTEYKNLPVELDGMLISLTDPSFSSLQASHFLTKNNNLLVTCGTLEQFEILESSTDSVGYAIRLNTSELLKEDSFCQAESPPSRFGISSFEIELIKKMTMSKRNHFTGFHMHHGSLVNSPNTFKRLASQVLKLCNLIGIQISYLNLGGGLQGLPFDMLEALIKDLRTFIPTDVTLVFEPGRFLVQNAGFAVGRILAVRKQREKIGYILNLSRSCHLRWAEPKTVALNKSLSSKTKVTLYGPTCYEGDTFGEFEFPTDSKDKLVFSVGEKILFSNINGYAVSWNTGFNGIKPAQLIFLN